MKVQLFIIDPQNDFMGEDNLGPDGLPIPLKIGNNIATLPVRGAISDMKRVAKLVKRVGRKLDDIHVTMDSHRPIDVAHPAFWKDQNGKHPTPFTLIFSKDIESGMWNPRDPALRKRMIDYTKSLEAAGKYILIIWPEHCRIGTWGHNVQEDLMVELLEWERREFANVDYVTKGTNPYTEHYGGYVAEVPDAKDESTQPNMRLLRSLQDADLLAVCGEASSHCVRATVTQIVEAIGDEHLKKIHLLTDCMSPVGATPQVDFPAIAASFLKEMESKGLNLTAAADFLA